MPQSFACQCLAYWQSTHRHCSIIQFDILNYGSLHDGQATRWVPPRKIGTTAAGQSVPSALFSNCQCLWLTVKCSSACLTHMIIHLPTPVRRTTTHFIWSHLSQLSLCSHLIQFSGHQMRTESAAWASLSARKSFPSFLSSQLVSFESCNCLTVFHCRSSKLFIFGSASCTKRYCLLWFACHPPFPYLAMAHFALICPP